MSQKPDYLFGASAAARERQRLLLVQREFDPATVARLESFPVMQGWNCLEVGCGAGSILRWLSHRVGSTGHAVGVDLDIRAVDDAAAPNIELREGDIATLDLGERCFDFIHARFVLIHVHQREVALRNIIRALKPGGLLFLEEPDFGPAGPAFTATADAGVVQRTYEAMRQLYLTTGGDPFIGKRLPTWIQHHGIEVTGAAAAAALWRGGDSRAILRRVAVEQLFARLVATSAATADDLQRFIELAGAPTVWAYDYTTVSAWGHKTGS